MENSLSDPGDPYIRIGWDSVYATILRFRNVLLPLDATITSVKLSLVALCNDSLSVSVKVFALPVCYEEPWPLEFDFVKAWYSGLMVGREGATWVLEQCIAETELVFESDSLARIVQASIDDPLFVPGCMLVIYLTADSPSSNVNYKRFYSFDASGEQAAKLIIKYTVKGKSGVDAVICWPRVLWSL